MKKQRGLIPISLIIYGIAAAVALGSLWWVWSEWKEGRQAKVLLLAAQQEVTDCPADRRKNGVGDCIKWVKENYAKFVADTKALGDAAEAKARAQELADKKLKEKVDADHKTTVARLAAESARLRNARASERFLPSTGTATPSPTVTADRAKLEAALRDFDTAVTAIVDEGDQAIADLNSAKRWAKP